MRPTREDLQEVADIAHRYAFNVEAAILNTEALMNPALVEVMAGAQMLARGAFMMMSRCPDPECLSCKERAVNAWRAYALRELEQALDRALLSFTETKGSC